MLLFEDKEYFLDTQYKVDYSSGFTEIEDNTNEIPIIKEYDKIYKNNNSGDISIYLVKGKDNFYISGNISGYEVSIITIRPNWYKVVKIPENIAKTLVKTARKKRTTKKKSKL